MGYHQIGTITVLDDGWVIEFGNRHTAVRSEDELGAAVRAAGLALRAAGGQVPAAPTPGGLTVPHPTVPPDEGHAIQQANLLVLARALVAREIEEEAFQRGVQMGCPDLGPEDVAIALSVAEQDMYEPSGEEGEDEDEEDGEEYPENE